MPSHQAASKADTVTSSDSFVDLDNMDQTLRNSTHSKFNAPSSLRIESLQSMGIPSPFSKSKTAPAPNGVMWCWIPHRAHCNLHHRRQGWCLFERQSQRIIIQTPFADVMMLGKGNNCDNENSLKIVSNANHRPSHLALLAKVIHDDFSKVEEHKTRVYAITAQRLCYI